MDRERRRELAADFRRKVPTAGVYRVFNPATGFELIAATANVTGARSRFEFALKTGEVAALPPAIRDEALRGGLSGLTFEVLETMEGSASPTPEDLAELEALVRERLDAQGRGT